MTNPNALPTIKETMTAYIVRSFVPIINEAAKTSVNIRIDPTERSIPPVKTTKI